MNFSIHKHLSVFFVLLFFILYPFHIYATTTTQGLVLDGTKTFTLTAPTNHPAVSGLGSNRFEFRLHGIVLGGNQPIFSPTNNVTIAVLNNKICVDDFIDTFFDQGRACADLTGHSSDDITVRIQRDTIGKTLSAIAYKTDGWTVIDSQTILINTVGSQTWLYASQNIGFFTNITTTLVWFKWYSSATASQKMTKNNVADLMDFRFENSIIDQSPIPVTLSGSASYTSTSNYTPVCVLPQEIFPAGSFTLDGTQSFSINGQDTLTYSWGLVSGPNMITWTNQSTAQPTVSGSIFGSYVFQLTVTDSDGMQTNCTTKDGSVVANSSGRVLVDDLYADYSLGPMTIYGTNNWPLFDQRQRQTADFFGSLQSTTYQPVWRTASTHGTISVQQTTNHYTSNIQAIVGTGTSFASDFFGGTCGGVRALSDGGNSLVLWYPNHLGNFGYRFMTPYSCTDDTHMLVREPYDFGSAAVTNASYSIMTTPQIAIWVNGSTNTNYYDNVLAFYALYYRTGIDNYLTYARNLADWWYEMPSFDKGQACGSANDNSGYWCPPPRVQALLGLMLRAQDGRSDMWDGLSTGSLDADRLLVSSTDGYAGDPRETAAVTASLCSAAYFLKLNMLDAVRYSSYLNKCKDLTTQYFSVKVTSAGSVAGAGTWVQDLYPVRDVNGTLVAATVTNGSSTITLSSPIVCPSNLSIIRVWITSAPNVLANSDGDTKTFSLVSCSGSTLSISPAYNGTHAGVSSGIVLDTLGGQQSQPFITGYVASALSLAQQTFDATNNTSLASSVRTIVVNAVLWLHSYGFRPATHGYFYVRGGLLNDTACEPDPEIANNPFIGGDFGYLCTAQYDTSPPAIQGSRFLMAETVRAISQAYSFASGAQKNEILDFGNQVFGAMWGRPGELYGDSNYLSTFYPATGNPENKAKAKDFGFAFGWGAGYQWAGVTASVDITSPVLSLIFSTPTQTTSLITWTTNESSSSQVEYGSTLSYGQTSVLDSTLVTNHSVVLSGLTPGTVYHYRVKSADVSSNLATSSDQTFTTTATVVPVAVSFVSSGGGRSPILPPVVVPVAPTVSLNPVTQKIPVSIPINGSLANLPRITFPIGRRSKKSLVLTLQVFLNLTVPNTTLVADGIFGHLTLVKIKEFQKLHGLIPDGILGKKTREVMNGMR
jgi:peptidoglycan hydrolase-like protein with peptidoglycan-binding domain